MKTPAILVTGGTGYIGSHTSVSLIEQGYEVIALDNLSNSNDSSLDGIEAGVIHFTGLKTVERLLKSQQNFNFEIFNLDTGTSCSAWGVLPSFKKTSGRQQHKP